MDRWNNAVVVCAVGALGFVGACDTQDEGMDPADVEALEVDIDLEQDEDAPDGTSPSAAGEFGAQDPGQDGFFPWPRGNCRGLDQWEEHGVYETTLIYFVDEVLAPGDGPFLIMEDDRNTQSYREESFEFFEERYGMVFDPDDPGIQVISDGKGGTAEMVPTKFGSPGETSSHQVYGIDAQRIPQWRNKLPVTNVAFRDDGFFVFVQTDFEAHGTYGGDDGLIIRGGDVLVKGEYRMFNERDYLLDTIRYEANTPATINPFNGTVESSDGAVFVNITCDLDSDIFGHGLVRALGEMRPTDDGGMDLDFRYVARWPARVADADVDRPRCKYVRPLWWW